MKMYNSNKHSDCFLPIMPVVTVLRVLLVAFMLLATTPCEAALPSDPNAIEYLRLLDSANAMARGEFEIGRNYLDTLGSQVDSLNSLTGGRLVSLLDPYDELIGKLTQGRKEAYDKYHKKLIESMARARWRQVVLDSSLAHELDSSKLCVDKKDGDDDDKKDGDNNTSLPPKLESIRKDDTDKIDAKDEQYQVAIAQWRQSLLRVSAQYDLDSEEKDEFEARLSSNDKASSKEPIQSNQSNKDDHEKEHHDKKGSDDKDEEEEDDDDENDNAKEYDWDSKQGTETALREQIREDWLECLAQLSNCQSMIKRFDLDEEIDSSLRKEVISTSLRVANKLEELGLWSDAYGYYYYLTNLDKANDEYDSHGRQLLQHALLEALYAPDPNTDGVPWQERRKDASVDIIRAALAVMSSRYVEENPDFKEMTLRGMENCHLLAETGKLSQTFVSLSDTDKTSTYLTALDNLRKEVESMTAEQIARAQVIEVLLRIRKINKLSLELPDEIIIAEYGEGLFGAVDTYTRIVWPGDAEEFRKDITGEFFGIGILISKVKGQLTVDSLLEDNPAYRAGLDAGDKIIKIDGKSTANITLSAAVRRITGKEGTDVTLTIKRESLDEPRDFTITRQRIVAQSVKGAFRDADGKWQYFIDPENDLAYVRLTSFLEETPHKLRQVLRRLRTEEAKALVLDLRGNGGGYYESAVAVVNAFVPAGVIVSSRYRPPLQEFRYARPEAVFDAHLPLAVLVNSASASASEIVSGALQYHGRAVVIGTRTFGKGSVQQTTSLGNKAEMKITIARYHLPDGRCVHRDPEDRTNESFGVKPNVSVELTGQQLQDYLKVSRKASVLHLQKNSYLDDGQDDPNGWHTYDADEILESDPQLQIACLCLRAELLSKSIELDIAKSTAKLSPEPTK